MINDWGRWRFPFFGLLAALAAGAAGAHELVPAANFEGLAFSSAAAVAFSADGRDVYAAGASPDGNYWTPTVGSTAGLAWLRRDPLSGRLEFRRNYLSRGGDAPVYGVVLDAAGEHLYALTATRLLTARRGDDGSLALAGSVALPFGLDPRQISLLPDGRLYVGGIQAAAIYDRQGDGVALNASFFGDPWPSFWISVLADDLVLSGGAAFRRIGGEWVRQSLDSVPNDFVQRGHPVDRSPDGRYFYQLSFEGEGGFSYNYMTHEIVSPGYYAQVGSSWLGILTGDREITSLLLHPTTGHLYVASIARNTGGAARIDHLIPVGGGRGLVRAESLDDPAEELGRRTAKISLALAPGGRQLYANFGGEPLALLEIDPASGALSYVPRAAGLQSRFERPFAAVAGAPGEAYVLAPNAVFQVRRQEERLVLASTLELDGWTAAAAPREVRGLALAPDRKLGVVASSRDLALARRQDPGGELQLLPATSVRLPADFRDLAISPNGRFVYATLANGTAVYELRPAAPELVPLQVYPERGEAIRISPDGLDAVLVRYGTSPVFLGLSPATGALAWEAFQSDGVDPQWVEDAFFAGDRLILVHGDHGGPAPDSPTEILVRQPDRSWHRIAYDYAPSSPLGLQIPDTTGRYVLQLGGFGLNVRGILPELSGVNIAGFATFAGASLGSAGAPFASEGWNRLVEPFTLLDGDLLLFANPASGNLQLFRRGCGWAEAKPCLGFQRFEVEVDWRDADGGFHPATVEKAGSDDSQIFTFFDPRNWELLVKVLDGCGLNDRFWVFAAASTDVGFDLRVRDSWTGALRTWSSPAGAPAPALTDIDAFATCEAAIPGRYVDAPVFPPLAASPVIRLANQFDVKVEWTDHQGHQGQATGLVKANAYNESGLFYFFAADNWEMQVKVLTGGCSYNGHFWVLASASTDVGYELQIHDPFFQRTRSYRNPVGRASPAIIDLQAFPCE